MLAPACRRRCDLCAGTGRALFRWLLLGFGCPAFALGLDALLGQRADRGVGQRRTNPTLSGAELVGEIGDVQMGLREVAGGIGQPDEIAVVGELGRVAGASPFVGVQRSPCCLARVLGRGLGGCVVGVGIFGQGPGVRADGLADAGGVVAGGQDRELVDVVWQRCHDRAPLLGPLLEVVAGASDGAAVLSDPAGACVDGLGGCSCCGAAGVPVLAQPAPMSR